jgi:hypothetical protein
MGSRGRSEIQREIVNAMVLAAMRRAFQASWCTTDRRGPDHQPDLPPRASWDDFLAGRRGKFKQCRNKLLQSTPRSWRGRRLVWIIDCKRRLTSLMARLK